MTHTYFIKILSDYMAGRITEASDADWDIISRLARQHQVGGIVYRQCRELLPAEVRPELEAQYNSALYYHMLRKKDLKELLTAFDEEDIEVFTVKGLEVARYYPVPALRTMGDTDLVVHTENRKKADTILLELGYTSHRNRGEREWVYFRQDMEYELHDHLLYPSPINTSQFMECFNDFWPYVKDGKLDISFHYLFLLFHLRKHLLGYGVGFRQFMDVAVVGRNEPKLNWPWIMEKLEELGLMHFAEVLYAVFEKWFGITSPIKPAALDDDFYQAVTSSVLNNGIFGLENEENRKNIAVNDVRKGNGQRSVLWKGIARYLFPSYQKMKEVQCYSYLEGKPLLLPFAWFHRFLRGLGKFGTVKDELKIRMPSGQEISKRDEYLRQWGL